MPRSTTQVILYQASERGYENIVKMLLNHDADQNIIFYSWVDDRARKALDIAIEKGHAGAANLLRTF